MRTSAGRTTRGGVDGGSRDRAGDRLGRPPRRPDRGPAAVRPARRGRAAGRPRPSWCKQLDDYVLPRLATIDAPLLAVVGGSTGAGKSTLVNSLVGRRVTAPGVIRPTTRAPVLVHHGSDAQLVHRRPGAARSGPVHRAPAATRRSLQLVADDAIPPGLAILDAPDIDSVVADNRKLAAQLLAAADLWLFVTSAARYADAVPWDFLLSAADRSAAVAVVLDRVPPRAMAGGARPSRPADGRARARPTPRCSRCRRPTSTPRDCCRPPRSSRSGAGWPRWPRTRPAGPPSCSRPWTAPSPRSRARPRRRAAVDEQAAAAATSCAPRSTSSYAEAVRTVAVQTEDGTLLRGEVLARWQEFVGTGEFFRALEQKIGWLRDRITAVFRGEPPGVGDLKVAVELGAGVAAAQRGRRRRRAGRGVLAGQRGRAASCSDAAART